MWIPDDSVLEALHGCKCVFCQEARVKAKVQLADTYRKLMERCTDHPVTLINTGEKVYPEHRYNCGLCLEEMRQEAGE